MQPSNFTLPQQLFRIHNWAVLLLLNIVAIGCRIDSTNYYADGTDTGLAIFSNTGNNVMSCYIDGKPWRTFSRTFTGFSPGTSYEISISRFRNPTGTDTLSIDWRGYFQPNNSDAGTITLRLSLPPGFTYRNLNALHGQRFTIDNTNGRFIARVDRTGIVNSLGAGSIYFNTARFDSIGLASYRGVISGLLEAGSGTVRITRGRFDHQIDPPMIDL